MKRSLAAAVLGASLLVAARVSWCAARGAAPAFSPLSIAALLAAGLACGHAAAQLVRPLASRLTQTGRLRNDARFGQGLAAGWFCCAVLAIGSWPQGLDPLAHPLASLALFGVILALPVAVLEARPQPWAALLARRYRQAITLAALGASLVAAATYLRAARPSVGDVDFFCYVCCARDMLRDPPGDSESCYRYFPGVYAFWRAVMRWTDGSLESLQSAYVLALAANALLAAAIVQRLARSAAAAVYAALWCVAFYSRFEGLAGVTEPIATIPFLVGLWIWGGRPLQGREGAARSVLLGLGLGLALCVKQQAGLLSLAALTLPAGCRLPRRGRRHAWAAVLLAPPAAAAAFLAGVLWEGKGLTPLRMGLQMAVSYERQGAWLHNLYLQARNDESAALAAAFVLAALVALLLSRRRRRLWGRPWLAAAAFAAAAALAATVQFASRGYRHYALLAAPGLVLAAVLLAAPLARAWLAGRKRSELSRFALLGLAALPLAHTGGNPDNFHAWRIVLPAAFAPRQPWFQHADVAADLQRLRREIQPGERLLVLPPRRNSVHFLLGTCTASDSGYAFAPRWPADVSWEQCHAAVLIAGELEGREDALRRSLKRRGFRPRLQLPTMALYRPAR